MPWLAEIKIQTHESETNINNLPNMTFFQTLKSFFTKTSVYCDVQYKRINLTSVLGDRIVYMRTDNLSELFEYVERYTRYSMNVSCYNVFLTHTFKVLRADRTFTDYNIPDNATITINFAFMVGGCKSTKPITYKDILVPPYTIVLTCEHEVIMNYLEARFVNLARVQGDYSDLLAPFSGKMDDTLVKLLEDIVLSTTLFINAQNSEQKALAITTFLKLRFKGSLVSSIFKMIESATDLLEPSVQGVEQHVDDFRMLIREWRNIKGSTMGKKYEGLLGVMCRFGAFSLIGIDPPRTWKGETTKPTLMDSGDLVFSLIDTLSYSFQRVCIYARTGSWQTFIHGPEQYMKWFDEAMELRRLTLNMGNLETFKTTYHDVVDRVKKAIEQGKSIVKYADFEGKGEIKSIKQTLNDLMLIESNILTKKAAQENRRIPFSCLIHGKSGVAKSMFTNLIGYYYSKRYDLPSGAEFRHTRIFTDEFWSGFSSQQWWIHLDDVALFHHSKVMGPDPTTCDLISVINPFSFSPNQASLEDKGKTPMKARLVTATTNTKDMNVSKFFQCPLAVQRRLPFIFTVTPKPEYCKTDSPQMIDPSKIPVYDNGWPDVWLISVEKVVAGGTTGQQEMAKFEVIQQFSDINLFLDWFFEVSMEFERIQDKALRDDSYMLNFKLCLSCNRVTCECETLANLSITGDDLRMQGYESIMNCSADYEFQDETEVWEDDHEHGIRYIYNKVRKEKFVAAIPVVKQGKTANAWMCEMPFVVDEYCKILDQVVTKVMRDESSIVGRLNARIINAVTKAYTRWSWARSCGDYMLSFRTVRLCVHWYATKYITISKGARVGMWYLGEMAYKTYMRVEWLKIMQGLVLATTLWRGYTLSTNYVQGQTMSALSPSPDVKRDTTTITVAKSDGSDLPKDEKENVWKNDDFVLTPLDLTPKMVGYKQLAPTQVSEIIFRNAAKIVCTGLKGGLRKISPANALCVGGHLWITTNHTLLKCDDGNICIELITQIRTHGISPNVKFFVEESSVLRIPELDLAFFECYAMDAGKNLIELFPLKDMTGTFDGYLMGRGRNFDVFKDNLRCLKKKTLYAADLSSYFDYWSGNCSRNTEAGDCGSIVLAMQPQVMILGLHQLGGSMFTIGALCIYREVVLSAVQHFGKPLVQGGLPKLCSESAKKFIGPLHHRSPVRWLESGVCKVYGSFIGWRAIPRSRVIRTFLYGEFKEKRGWDPKYARPEMNDWRPWHFAYKEIVEQEHNIKESVLRQCIIGFVNDILKRLPASELNKLKVLDKHAAVNGVQGVRFLDKMNFNTSMGEPWCTKKKKFVSPDPTIELPDAKKFSQEIMDRVDDIEQTYLHGTRVCPVFSGQLKDEVRSEKKVLEGRLRAFSASPADWSILVRMYLLTFIMVFQNSPFIFEGAPGCVAQSLAWEQFREYLCSFGVSRLVAGDYKAFDKKMLARLIIAAYEIIIGVLKKAGWSDQELLVIWGIAEDTAYSWINCNGDFVQFMGSNPSGHPLTVIVNCLVNGLYLRYCYYELNPAREVESFKDHVALLTYGDDNAFGVSIQADWFNHTSISGVLAKIGVTYTMADKLSASVPFIHIDDVSFLKRSWLWDRDIGAYVCPLEEDSIQKSLMFTIPSANLTTKMHMLNVMHSAINEFFFYGKCRFESEREFLINLIQEVDMCDEYLTQPFPKWETLYIRFWKSSQDVKLERYVDRQFIDDHVKIMGAEESSCHMTSPTPPLELDLVQEKLDFSLLYSVLSQGNPSSHTPIFLDLAALGADNEITGECALAGANSLKQIQATQTFKCSLVTQSKLTPFEREARVQSDVVAADSSVEQSMTTNQTTQFLDANLGSQVGYTPDHDYMAESDGVTSAGLAQFLSRPVRIANFTWAESDPLAISQTFLPWQLFFNDTAIKSKLNNFAFIRCNLKLKFVINASPFYYGLMKACYRPLQDLTNDTIVHDSGTRYFIPLSQRPHVDIFPQLSEGAVMTLPFFLHRSWLRVSRSSDFAEMGKLEMVIYSALRSANGVVGQGCSVQIYAWAEDVVLSGPTLGLSMQGDEYGDGIVSAPASTVARIAGMIKGIPIIGKFATATEIGANAISGIAKLFGWTNVPVITDAQPYRMVPFPQFASPEIGYPTEKLTLDAKNELSVDPKAIGAPDEDHLSIESICTRKSYLCRATWDTSTSVDTLLFGAKVSPFQFETEVLTASKVYLTPMAMVSRLFQEWRGDIIFTFQFIVSPFHKGRVRISYDPYNTTVQTVGDIGSTLFNTIIDIGEVREVDVRIPYQQALQWLTVDSDWTQAKSFITSGSGLTIDDTRMNGIIAMKALTLLTAPVAASTVDILIYVRGADNLEFANPIHPGNDFTLFAVQGDEQIQDDDPALEMIDFKASPDMYLERYRLNFGECVKSTRPLLRRINYTETFTGTSDANLDIVLWQRHSRYPLYYGYDPNGLHAASGTIVPGSTFPFNFVKNTPYHLIAPAFICQKGSVHWHYNAECDFPTSQMSVTRINARTGVQVVMGVNTRTGAANNATAAFYMVNTNGTGGGMSLTNTRTQSGLNVSIPNYTQYLFESTNPGNVSKPPIRGATNYDGSEREFVQVQVNCDGTNGPKPQNVKMQKHFGVGTDFNLFFFINVPVYYLITTVPNSA